MEERWKEEIVDQMREALENENVTVDRKSVELRGRETDTVSVNFKDAPYTMHFELDKYCDMVSVGVPTSEIAFALAREANDAHLHAPNLRSPEELQRSLYCTVANADMHKELMVGRPYMKVQDLVVVPRCKISEDARGMSSFAVTDEHLGLIQLTREEVMERAMANTVQEGFQLQTMGEMMRGLVGGLPDEMQDEMLATPVTPSVYVLTNATRMDGAVAIACPEALEEAKKTIGEDFYILPSSRHEVLLVPHSLTDSPKDLEDMVKAVNATTVSREDFLSDHVYSYDGLTKSVSMISTALEEKGMDLMDKLTEKMTERLERSEGRRR